MRRSATSARSARRAVIGASWTSRNFAALLRRICSGLGEQYDAARCDWMTLCPALRSLCALPRFGTQPDRLPRDHEHPIAPVVHGPRVLFRGIDPCLQHLEHEEIVFRRQARVDDSALEIRVALRNEWSCDARSGQRREAKLLELVDCPAPDI